MNDVSTASEAVRARPAIVRPRDAASLILLRGKGRDLELLAGRRPGHVKFMPGVWVFPGGAIDPEDRKPWRVETGGAHFPPRLARCARAALRETWEEVGVLVGRRTGSPPPAKDLHRLSPIEAAYAERGVGAALDALTYIGRAITPTPVFRRFNTRFFLADGDAVIRRPRIERRTRRRRLAPDRPQGARAVSRRDAVHVGARRSRARRHGAVRCAAVLHGAQQTAHPGLSRSRTGSLVLQLSFRHAAF